MLPDNINETIKKLEDCADKISDSRANTVFKTHNSVLYEFLNGRPLRVEELSNLITGIEYCSNSNILTNGVPHELKQELSGLYKTLSEQVKEYYSKK